MGDFIAERITAQASGAGGGRMLILGLTFKEDVPDLRNSKVIDVINGLKRRGFSVDVHDPMADVEEAEHEYGVELKTGTLGDVVAAAKADGGYDGVVAAVPHRQYASLSPKEIAGLVKPGGIVADIKGIWRGLQLPDNVRRWTL